MDLSRISTVIDIEKTQNVTVALIGTGGSADLACSLARCGVRRFVLVDPDRIKQHNVARQRHDAPEVGIPKVKALAKMIERINSEAEVVSLTRDFTAMTDEEIDAAFGAINLFIFATDSFAAQARGNQVALRLGVSALWVGLYRGDSRGKSSFGTRNSTPVFAVSRPSGLQRRRTHVFTGNRSLGLRTQPIGGKSGETLATARMTSFPSESVGA